MFIFFRLNTTWLTFNHQNLWSVKVLFLCYNSFAYSFLTLCYKNIFWRNIYLKINNSRNSDSKHICIEKCKKLDFMCRWTEFSWIDVGDFLCTQLGRYINFDERFYWYGHKENQSKKLIIFSDLEWLAYRSLSYWVFTSNWDSQFTSFGLFWEHFESYWYIFDVFKSRCNQNWSQVYSKFECI